MFNLFGFNGSLGGFEEEGVPSPTHATHHNDDGAIGPEWYGGESDVDQVPLFFEASLLIDQIAPAAGDTPDAPDAPASLDAPGSLDAPDSPQRKWHAPYSEFKQISKVALDRLDAAKAALEGAVAVMPGGMMGPDTSMTISPTPHLARKGLRSWAAAKGWDAKVHQLTRTEKEVLPKADQLKSRMYSIRVTLKKQHNKQHNKQYVKPRSKNMMTQAAATTSTATTAAAAAATGSGDTPVKIKHQHRQRQREDDETETEDEKEEVKEKDEPTRKRSKKSPVLTVTTITATPTYTAKSSPVAPVSVSSRDKPKPKAQHRPKPMMTWHV